MISLVLLLLLPVALLVLYAITIQYERGGAWRVFGIVGIIALPLDAPSRASGHLAHACVVCNTTQVGVVTLLDCSFYFLTQSHLVGDILKFKGT